MTLDSVLNIIIPFLIFLGLIILIYSKAQKPIDNFFNKIKDWISGNSSEILPVDEFDISFKGEKY